MARLDNSFGSSKKNTWAMECFLQNMAICGYKWSKVCKI